jgi:hypothetical protein
MLPGHSQIFVSPIRERKKLMGLANGFSASISRKWPGMYIVKMGGSVWMVHIEEHDLWLLGHWLTEWPAMLTGNYVLVDLRKRNSLEDVVERGPVALAALRIMGEI